MVFDLAFLALPQAADGRGQTVADGRSVFDQPAADAGQKRSQGALVGGQGFQEGCRGERRPDRHAVAVRSMNDRHLLPGAVSPMRSV